MIAYSSAIPTKSLYIHWPFCAHKCHFCDFIAFEHHDQFHEMYHEALCKEITLFAQHYPHKKTVPIETIFIGGGTPSRYPINLLLNLFELLHKHFIISPTAEITIETNPADITTEKLTAWRHAGINRLSMGVQILDDHVLANLNRYQRVRDVLNAIDIAPLFFSNISADLILGLPGVTTTSWFNTLETVLTWPIQHMSLYFLMTHEKTPLFFNLQNQSYTLWDEALFVENYHKSVSFLEKNNFIQYEISNFSHQDFQSAHNKAYWNGLPYKGFGISAASFDGFNRFINTKNLKKYLNAVLSENKTPTGTSECLSQEQRHMEKLMLSLRQTKGADLHDVVYLVHDTSKQEQLLQNITDLQTAGFINLHNNNITLTLKGMAMENEVILKLL